MVRVAGGRVRVGISGWSYPPWRSVFYPDGLRQADELRFASRAFPSVEINGSFYSLLRPTSCRAWYEATPDDFVFSIKGSRYITHMLRLRNVERALANFFASGLLSLGHKLGPILWQLPPRQAFDEATLRAFFALLPRTAGELAERARRHDERLAGRSLVEAPDPDLKVRHALEVRHESFADARYIQLLREYGVASCVADSAGLYPIIDEHTADFSYARLHGAQQLYVSGYSTKDLKPWAARVRAWQRTGDVFVYFDNDVKVRAPFDALNLARLLDGKRARPLPKALSSVTEEPRTNWPAFRRAAP
jgi:uncharacterized protein YecE (DUF72 family)